MIDGEFLPQSEEADVVKKQVVLMNTVLNNLRAKIEACGSDPHKLMADKNMLELQVKELTNAKNEFSARYNDSQTDNVRLTQERDNWKEKHDNLKQEYDILKQEHDKLMQEHQNLPINLHSVTQEGQDSAEGVVNTVDTVQTVDCAAKEPVNPLSMPQQSFTWPWPMAFPPFPFMPPHFPHFGQASQQVQGQQQVQPQQQQVQGQRQVQPQQHLQPQQQFHPQQQFQPQQQQVQGQQQFQRQPELQGDQQQDVAENSKYFYQLEDGSFIEIDKPEGI